MSEEITLQDAPPPKTITSVLAAAYRALNEAWKISYDHPDLKKALDDIPPEDMDAVVNNVLETYKAIEDLRVMAVGFEKANGGILAKVTLRFGENDITLAAPFDSAGSSVMLADLTEAVGKKSKILLVN